MNDKGYINGVLYTFSDEEQSEFNTIREQSIIDKKISKWLSLREQRNQLLAETDHYALQDVDLSDEMITYRQALRDLPATVNIDNPVFPEKP